MMHNKTQGGRVIVLSIVVAIMLTAMPLPEWALDWRPVWVAMVLMYWAMALPGRVGIGIAWFLGLLIDVLQGTLLGLNAMGFALLCYLVLKSYQRIRVFPLTQQAFLVGIFLLFYLLLTLWIQSLTGAPQISWTYWMPAISSMLLWPWLFIILRDIRRKYNVS